VLQALALLFLLTASPAGAFILQGDTINGRLRHPRWKPGSMPVSFKLNDHPFELLPNLESGSMPLEAISAAMRTWSLGPVQCSLDGMTSAASIGRAGINLITFADTPQNRAAAGNSSGQTTVWYLSESGQIHFVEADVVLSPKAHFATDGRPGVFDLQDRLTRSLGYVLSLCRSTRGRAPTWRWRAE
jgi:hypothetical protein